jgi:hypothetical protein
MDLLMKVWPHFRAVSTLQGLPDASRASSALNYFYH